MVSIVLDQPYVRFLFTDGSSNQLTKCEERNEWRKNQEGRRKEGRSNEGRKDGGRKESLLLRTKQGQSKMCYSAP